MLKLWLPVLVCTAAAFAQRSELPERETLTYNIEWRLITAGKANLTWRQDRDGVNIDARVESVGLVSKLFRVEDEYQARLGATGCTETARLTSHEGNRERETRITFEAAARRADYLERDRARNTVLQQHSIEIPPCVHDVLGGLYFMRTLNLEPGQSASIPVSDGKKFAMAKVEAQQREDVKTPEGLFHTIRYEIYLFNDVLYHRPAHVYVWLTDDRRKLPVEIRVRMQFTIGTITLLLEKHE